MTNCMAFGYRKCQPGYTTNNENWRVCIICLSIVTLRMLKFVFYTQVELGDITIFIMILKCHNNRYRRNIFSIVISLTQYYHKYHDYHKIQTCTLVKCFHLIFTILVAVVLLSDIVIILIIVL